MAGQSDGQSVWDLAERQHGVVSRAQLLELGYTRAAIEHRRERGRLHDCARGVYAVGRPELSRYGQMSVAVLACGPGAVISHETAAELWRLRRPEPGPLEVSIAGRHRRRRRRGIRVHPRSILTADAVTTNQRVPVTSVTLTLVDLGNRLAERHLEAAVNMADSLDLLDAEHLRTTLEQFPHVAGVVPLRRLLAREAFRLTDSELERMFRRLVTEAGLQPPETQRRVSGHRVDFVWPDIDLVVETDSLRYHRTPLQQRRDAARDHAHLLAQRESVRFTHFQVAHERSHVRRTLSAAWRKAQALSAVN